MLKILHLLNYLGSGGSEKYIYSLAKKLHGKLCEFYIAYSDDCPARSMYEKLGKKIIPLRMNRPVNMKEAYCQK